MNTCTHTFIIRNTLVYTTISQNDKLIIACPKGVLPSTPKGGLFRYHVKRIHFTMQGFGFLYAILMQNRWPCTTTTEVPPLFNLARFDLNKDCCWKNYLQPEVIILAIRFAVLSPGGVLPMWWVIHMCRGFDPLFSLWQDRARSFWGIFSHPPTPKRSFGVLLYFGVFLQNSIF